MDAVETAVAQTSALAGSARDIAAARCPPRRRTGPAAWRRWTRTASARRQPARFRAHVAKGAAGGGRRWTAGKVPAGHLPDSIPLSQKGAVDGVTPLDASGKVPVAHLPKLDYLPVIQRGAPDGVAPLDAARCRRPTCRRWRMPFRWRRRASQWRRRCRRRRSAAQLPLIESIPMGFVAWAPKRARSGRAGFPAMDSSCRGRRFRIWRRPSPTALFRSCPRPSGWRIRSSGAYTLGDGTTSIRVPDYNGPRAIGAAFLRGWHVVRGEWRDQG